MKKSNDYQIKTVNKVSSNKKIINNSKSIGKQMNSFLVSQSLNQGDKSISSKSKENHLSKCIDRSQSKPGSCEMIEKKASRKILQSTSPPPSNTATTTTTINTFDCIYLFFIIFTIVTKIEPKFFFQTINKHFKHLKLILPLESYNEIKEYFLNIIHSLLASSSSNKASTDSTMIIPNNTTNASSIIHNESQSSLFAYVINDNDNNKAKDKEIPLKLSMNFNKANNDTTNNNIENNNKLLKEKTINSSNNNNNSNSNNNKNHTTTTTTTNAYRHHNNNININNNNNNNNSHSNLNINVVSSKKNNQVKHSLYNLIKGRSHVTPSNSKSKSASRECSNNTRKPLSNPKHKEIININLTKKMTKPSITSINNNSNTINNQPSLNGKLLTKMTTTEKKTIKEGSLEKSNKKLGIVNFTIESVKSDKPLSKKSIINQKKIKPAMKYDKNQKITNELTAKIKEMKPQMIYLKMNSSNGPLLDNDSNIHCNNLKIQPSLNIKNDVMKEIEQTLDDNYKGMFNFSYENFLSKESESLSKQSQDDDINNNNKDDIDNNDNDLSQSV